MKRIIAISLAMMIGIPALANGVSRKDACLTQADPKAHSAWRIIEGKKCWYRGYRGRARESLYWPPAREVPPMPLDGLDRAPSQGAEPLKDRIDRALEAIRANQPQPPPSQIPLPPPKPPLNWWERLWQKWQKWTNWWWWGEETK